MSPRAEPKAFLFTDIVGSTEQWELDRARMGVALSLHDDALRNAIASCGGHLFKHTGDGVCAAFSSARDAVGAALDAHRRLSKVEWPEGCGLQVRMAIHAGPAQERSGDYFGPTVNRTARLLSVASVGQVVLSETASRAAKVGTLENGASRYLGSFRFKGIETSMRTYVLVHPDLPISETSGNNSSRSKKPKHNLQEDERPFIGRQAELANLRHRFLSERQRLVTITGIGGMGKTRLSRQFARTAASDFADGAVFVECESASTRDEIASVIATTLGIPSGSVSPVEAIEKHLFKREMLLVLDCFEGAVEHARLVEQLIASCPSVRVLVTSRVVLGVPREHELPLQPLAGNERSRINDAVELFLECAGHVVDGLDVTRQTRKIVSDIVERLECVPLSLVLAASRLRYVSLNELRATLDIERISVLHRRQPGTDRHARIVDVIAGSLQLLPETTKQAFVELSVFTGGFTRSAAAEVCGRNVAEEIELLRDHSLVVMSSAGIETRYRILDTLREYALSTADCKQLESAKQRHSAWFAHIATAIRESSERGEWESATATLHQELGNLKSGIAYAIETHQHALIRDYANGLLRSLFENGLYAEFESLSTGAIRASTSLEDLNLTIMVLGLKGALQSRLGDDLEAEKTWKERLNRCAEANNQEQAADTLIDLANIARSSGNLEVARAYVTDAERAATEAGIPGLLATVVVARIDLMIQEGNRSEAEELAVRLSKEASDPSAADYWLYVFGSLGRIFGELGKFRDAVAALNRALDLAMKADRKFAAGFALAHIGQALSRLDRVDAAYAALCASTKLHSHLKSKMRKGSSAAFRRFRNRQREYDSTPDAARVRGLEWEVLATRVLALAEGD